MKDPDTIFKMKNHDTIFKHTWQPPMQRLSTSLPVVVSRLLSHLLIDATADLSLSSMDKILHKQPARAVEDRPADLRCAQKGNVTSQLRHYGSGVQLVSGNPRTWKTKKTALY